MLLDSLIDKNDTMKKLEISLSNLSILPILPNHLVLEGFTQQLVLPLISTILLEINFFHQIHT